jgi:hypothetical protein
MNIIDKLKKIFNKQFFLTLTISEFIIIIDYASFYNYNSSFIETFDGFMLGLLFIIFSIICLLIFAKLIINKIFLFIPIGLFLLTLYVPLVELFGDVSNSFNSKLLSLAVIFLTWILLYYVYRYADSQKIIKNSFFISLIFFCTALVDFAFLKLDEKEVTNKESFELLKRNESPVQINFDPEFELPNIIYIVPDRYGGFDQLKNYFDYDNSDFLNALKDRGFIVGKNSRANYPNTYASVLSTLNSSYIVEPNDIKKTSAWAKPATVNSYAYKNLYDLGYKLFNISNWYTGTRFIANEEFNFYSEYNNQRIFHFYMNERMPFTNIVRKLSEVLLNKPSNFLIDNRFRCDIQKNQFKKLSDYAQNKNNGLFIFAHFIIPHPPYLLKANGDCNPASRNDISRDLQFNKVRYIESLKFFNKQILNIFDEMLKINKNFIFIIQSDEGPYPCYYENPCDTKNWDLKTSNINAFYTSKKLEINENDLKTPINNFIHIYNYLLDSDTQTLEHIVYKRKKMIGNKAFDFEVINDFETVN